VLALRLGKRINHPTDVLTLGIGLKLANLNYDVAFIPVRHERDMEMKWTMSLTYELPFISKRKLAAQKAADSLKEITPVTDTWKIQRCQRQCRSVTVR
jgi:hypothetical protein